MKQEPVRRCVAGVRAGMWGQAAVRWNRLSAFSPRVSRPTSPSAPGLGRSAKSAGCQLQQQLAHCLDCARNPRMSRGRRSAARSPHLRKLHLVHLPVAAPRSTIRNICDIQQQLVDCHICNPASHLSQTFRRPHKRQLALMHVDEPSCTVGAAYGAHPGLLLLKCSRHPVRQPASTFSFAGPALGPS